MARYKKKRFDFLMGIASPSLPISVAKGKVKNGFDSFLRAIPAKALHRMVYRAKAGIQRFRKFMN